MHDTGKIIIGIILLLIILLLPFWYNALIGKAGYVPELKIDGNLKECIEKTSYMRSDHTLLLNEWKDAAVRKGIRIYHAKNGKKYTISLTGTCLKCHPNKSEFCDRCHDYASVAPRCWECHNVPEKDKIALNKK